MRPGPNTQASTAIPPASSPTNTGTWFVVGPASQGPMTPTLITSFAQYVKIYGPRGTYAAALFDAVEAYFSEGGSRLYVCREFGGTAKSAEVKLKHVAEESIKVEAIGPGIWANAFKIVVAESSGTYTITIKNAAGETLEVSPALTTVADAVAWSKASIYVIITATGTGAPTAGTFELTGGTDETAGINTATHEAALKKFGPELGPGQISLPGVTATAALEALFKIAAEQKRRAVGDLPNHATKAELITAAAAIRGLGASTRAGSLWGSWQQFPPVVGTVAVRSVCPSAFVAAKCAVIDALGNPNLPVAGKQGVLFNTLGQESSFTEPEVEELYLAGVNLTKVVAGQVRLYGNRTPVNPQTDPFYVQFGNVRLDMAIEWKGLAIEENFMFSQLDGEGNDTAAYGNALKSMMLDLYKVGAVFGATPQEAFTVDTGPDVNTVASEAESNCNATIAARRSPGADQVNLNIVRVSITQEV